MTRTEYRAILAGLTVEQRGEICRLHSLAASNPNDIDSMVGVLDDQGVVAEAIIVRWLNRNVPGQRVTTEAERVAHATFAAAWYAKAAFGATVLLGVLSIVIAVIALLKG